MSWLGGKLLLSSLLHCFCPESFFKEFVSTPVSSLRSVFTVFNRYAPSISTGMSTSSFFVSVFPVRLRATGSSANAAVRFSASDFVANRFFTEVASCVSVRFCWGSELQALLCLVPLQASLRLPLASLWVPPSRLHALLLLLVQCRRLWFLC